MSKDERTPVEWMPLPEGAKLEIGTRSEPMPLVGITLNFGAGKLAFTYTPSQAREIAASILEAADHLDQEHSN